MDHQHRRPLRRTKPGEQDDEQRPDGEARGGARRHTARAAAQGAAADHAAAPPSSPQQLQRQRPDDPDALFAALRSNWRKVASTDNLMVSE